MKKRKDKIIVTSNAAGQVVYPAQFILIAAANPCPCGNLGSEKKTCHCMPGQIMRYKRKISGALLDRIDIHLTCPELSPDQLSILKSGEKSSIVRERVEKARIIQRARFNNSTIESNAEMSSKDLKDYCNLSEKCLDLLRQAVSKYTLSARSYHKMIKLSRTIADLDNAENIEVKHIGEALMYRVKEEV